MYNVIYDIGSWVPLFAIRLCVQIEIGLKSHQINSSSFFSADQPCWEASLLDPAWKNGRLNILHRKGETRKWRSTCLLCHRWTSFIKTLCTSELSLTQTDTQISSRSLQITQRRLFVHRTLTFNEFVKRASEKKHTDFFLCEVTVIKSWRASFLYSMLCRMMTQSPWSYFRMRAIIFDHLERTYERY